MGKTNDLPGSKGWKLFLALGESPRPIRFFFNELKENIYIYIYIYNAGHIVRVGKREFLFTTRVYLSLA